MCASFAGNTSSHSLRKGGARFYAGADAPEQATREQGGWRTTETIAKIYTALTKDEVKLAIHSAANTAGIAFALQPLAELIQTAGLSTSVDDQSRMIKFIDMVGTAVGTVPWKAFVELKVGVLLKRLVQHPDRDVRSRATTAPCSLRSAFSAYKADKR